MSSIHTVLDSSMLVAGTNLSDALSERIELVIIFGVGGVIALVAIIFGVISSMANNRERERTKRELAAYVAEGSMRPEDAERLLNSNNPSHEA